MGELTRRELLRDAAMAGTAVTVLGAAPAAGAKRRRRRSGPTVAVLGGGMAGLTVAHELAERGFRVHVYERKALGGKARSIPVPKTARGGRSPLPGEHGFRFFPGFYHHVPDTMRRIPVKGNANGVHDNLIAASEGKFLRANGRADAGPFGLGPDPQSTLLTPEGLQKYLTETLGGEGVPPHELQFFVNRIMVFLTSSDERRFGQWEHTSWWDFVKAEGKSQEYKTVIAAGLTRNLVAAKETVASARTIGYMGEAFIYNIQGRGNDGALDRVLDAPTNEAWIDPWLALLHRLGVSFHVGQAAESLQVRGGRIASARTVDWRGRRRTIEADYYVSAMPMERARRLLDRRILALDPRLEGMRDLFFDWMNGIQFYLREKVDITHGHITFIDAPWALTALTQAQFWGERDFARDYGNGRFVDCLSIDISNWDAPGILFGKPAKRCTREEVAREVWAQIRLHETAAKLLPERMPPFFLDPAIRWRPGRGRNTNDEPLLVNTIGSWEKRPQARTEIPNLFLSGDYVQTNIDLATMEGANESGRAAVNALLETAGSNAEPARMYTLYRPPEFEAAKAADAELYRQGRPNALDVQG
jgi:uncharacterized protein with NAD-binding domain and iron-sulfur cluster